jgi:hypothetical protein
VEEWLFEDIFENVCEGFWAYFVHDIYIFSRMVVIFV